MGMLSRFRDIMRSNLHGWLSRSEDPEKAVEDYRRALNQDLGQIRAENASVLMAERRAKRALEDCRAEIAKLQRYAERAVQAGNEAQALQFLERKAAQSAQEQKLLAAYEQASAGTEGMKRMEQKLAGDLAKLEARWTALQEKQAAAKAQERLNALGSAAGASALGELEERANKAYDEAQALAELRAEQQPDDLDELIARLVESQERAGEASGAATAGASVAGAAGGAVIASNTERALSPQEELAALRSKYGHPNS